MNYLTERQLKTIKKWEPKDFHGLMEFVRSIWEFADWGFHRDGDIYNISTGGWSGNEDIIYTMKKNVLWWSFYWEQSRRGGHYIFSKPDWLNFKSEEK